MENRKMVPEIRFSGFTDPWEQRKLGDIGKASGGTSIESEFDEFGKYKVISIGSYSVTNKYIDQGIRVNKTEKTENYILNKNDLTMILNDKTASGNIIGRVLLIDTDDSYVFNQRTERIEVNEDEYLPEFLYQLLNADNTRAKIILASQGNTQIYVNWRTISKLAYKITLSKDEQSKIAKIFTNVDNIITLHQRKLEKLKTFKKAMLDKMFPKNGKLVPEIRFSGFTDPWEQRKFNEIAVTRRGLTYNPSDVCEDGIRVLRSSNIKEDTFVTSDDDVFVKKDAINIPYACDGDILITSANGSSHLVGKHAIIRQIHNNSAVIGGFMLLATTKNPQFLNASMGSSWYTKFINLSVAGGNGAIGNLSKNELDEKTLFVPSDVEQETIGHFFKNIDNLITLHQRKLEKLQNIKKSMLNKMFI